MKFLQVFAVVDTEHRLLWVGGEWDEFALQNASNAALSNEVLSTSILEHIADDNTRAWTQRMIDLVLASKRPLRLEYRCDSPNMARKFQLTIQPMKDDRALMVHDLRDAWHFSPPLRPWHFDPAAKDCKCSFCGAVRFENRADWVASEDVGEKHPSHVTYEICPSCIGTLENAVSETEDANSERVLR